MRTYFNVWYFKIRVWSSFKPSQSHKKQWSYWMLEYWNVGESCLDSFQVTSEHSLVDVEVEDKDVTCKSHEGELIRYYCEQCSTCICVVCAFESPHRGHEVLTFSAALSRHGHALDSLVVDCKARLDGLRQQLELMRQLESDAMLAEEQVNLINSKINSINFAIFINYIFVLNIY